MTTVCKEFTTKEEKIKLQLKFNRPKKALKEADHTTSI
jgi:hypothetical protein